MYAVVPDRETGFAVADGGLSFSIRSEHTDKEQWPTVYFVAGHGLAAPAPLAPGAVVRGAPGDATFVYYGEQTRDVHVELTIVDVQDDALVVDLHVTTEDVLYAGEAARRTPATARVHLPRVAEDELWDPRREPA